VILHDHGDFENGEDERIEKFKFFTEKRLAPKFLVHRLWAVQGNRWTLPSDKIKRIIRTTEEQEFIS
jgi:hypothetical protein